MFLLRTFLFLGCTVGLLAQSDASQSDSSQASSADDYSGPAILSRGETPGTQSTAPLAFRPYIGVSAIYDYGLIPDTTTASGGIPSDAAYGVEANLGAYTFRTWKHTTLGLDYRGNYRHYPAATTWDGTDQLLSLILTHEPSKRIQFTIREQGGLYSQNYFLSSTLGALDPNYLGLPQNDIYDERVIFLGASGDMIYHLSSRLSFDIGAQGSLIRRQYSDLYGVTGAVARGDLEYRASRHSTIGADYRFTYFDYTRGFGTTAIQSVGVNYSTQFTRHVQLSARLGGARVDSSSLTTVALDPTLAALLGETVAIQAAFRLNYVPDVQVRLTDKFRRSQFTAQFLDTVIPGNGVFVSSRSEAASASYSYSGIRYWNFGVDGTYGWMTPLAQSIGAYTAYGGGAGITRELGKGLHAVLRLDTRHYGIADTALAAHTEYRASLGIAFSPGDLPLALW